MQAMDNLDSYIARHKAIRAELAKPVEQVEPAAHMFPSDLERFAESETFAQAFSVAVGSPDERSVPLYLHPPAPAWHDSPETLALKAERDRLLAVLRIVRGKHGCGALTLPKADLERIDAAIAKAEGAA